MPQQQQQQQQNGHGSGKQTPGRRRQGRNGNRSSGQKAYASENDMASRDSAPFHPDFVAMGPATPQKSLNSEGLDPKAVSLPVLAKTNKRSGNKTRPKNLSTSPGPVKPGRRTPPQSAGAKPSSATAFAGATFHASPAPSTLPIPSFFAKTMPDSPVSSKVPANISQEPSPPASDSEMPTPAQQLFAPQATPRDESPLDILFRADRAEKERARRASSANATGAAAPAPFSPPSLNFSPREHRTPPSAGALSQQQARRPVFPRNATVGISTSELDGTPGRPMGPAFSTPYQERIRAARSNGEQSQAASRALHQAQAQAQAQEPIGDRSEALKRYLFSGQKAPLASSPLTQATTFRQSRETTSFTTQQQSSSASTGLQQIYATSTMRTSEGDRSTNLAIMENNLRQILKLDSSRSMRGSAPQANRT